MSEKASIPANKIREHSRKYACDRCRGQKLRCERSLHGQETSPCKRCFKAGAVCVWSVDKEDQVPAKRSWNFIMDPTMNVQPCARQKRAPACLADSDSHCPRSQSQATGATSFSTGESSSSGRLSPSASLDSSPTNATPSSGLDWSFSNLCGIDQSLFSMLGPPDALAAGSPIQDLASVPHVTQDEIPWSTTHAKDLPPVNPAPSAASGAVTSSKQLPVGQDSSHLTFSDHNGLARNIPNQNLAGNTQNTVPESDSSAQCREAHRDQQPHPAQGLNQLNHDILSAISLCQCDSSVTRPNAQRCGDVPHDVDLPADIIDKLLQYSERLFDLLHRTLSSVKQPKAASSAEDARDDLVALGVVTSYIAIVRLYQVVFQSLERKLENTTDVDTVLSSLILPQLQLGKFQLSASSPVQIESLLQLSAQMLQRLQSYVEYIYKERQLQGSSLLHSYVEEESQRLLRSENGEVLPVLDEMLNIRRLVWSRR